MKTNRSLINSLIILREGERHSVVRDAHGQPFTVLDNYVVVPKEQYERLVILAGRQADLMVSEVLKIRRQPVRRTWRAVKKFWWGHW